jgi:hypothetical protein
MGGWLRPKKEEAEPLVAPDEVLAYVPSSVRGPEGNRFTPLGSDMPDVEDNDDDDEDLEFLASIARSVKETPDSVGQFVGTGALKPRAQPGERATAPASPLDDMRVFREMKGDLGDMKYDFKLADVDMADLLEDLSTTASALRQRKAA